MRHCSLLALSLAALVGCGSSLRHIAVDRMPLGKVVVYRNGVAYYERRARVTAGALTVRVPRERVDDFLKSLTVVDAATQRPLPVAFPRRQADDAPVIEMQLQVGDGASTSADVLMTYVTDAVAWKPSYRLVLGDDDAMLEGWAVVDNLSGEDWKRVEIGVGSSAAMSFRYDLWSVRTVEREELAADEAFATAPPTAVSPYGGTAAPGPSENVLTLDASEIRDVGGTSGAAGAGGEDRAARAELATVAGGGAVAGRVIDKDSKEAVIGATVVLSGPSGASRTAITDEDGRFAMPGLPAGTYLLTTFYGDGQFARPNVVVAKGKQAAVTIPIDPRIHAEIIELTGRAPVIDSTSTTQGISVDYTRSAPTGRTFESALGTAAGSSGDGAGVAFSGSSSVEGQYQVDGGGAAPRVDAYAAVKLGDAKLAAVAADLIKHRRSVVVQGYASTAEASPDTAALDRANLVRNQLIDAGVAPGRIRVESGGVSGIGSVQIVTDTAPAAEVARGPRASADTRDGTPVGESLFVSRLPMDVRDGSSAMVSVLRERTRSRPVYLYDGDGERGNARFAFRAVRLDNPTDQTLEAGPITVYGDGRYIGEGLTETVAPKASVIVPYALDRQIVVDRDGGVHDELARLVTLQRGILTAEVQHVRTTTLTLFNRSTEAATVYLRHPIEPGWVFKDDGLPIEKIGDTLLVEVAVAAGESRTVELRDTTPLTRRLELGATETLEQLKLFVASEHPSSELRAQLQAILAMHAELFDQVDRIGTLREHAVEYRARQAELTEQLVALRKLRNAGPLARQLADKATVIATRLQATTLAIVEAQDRLLLLRVRFQDALAELHLGDAAVDVARAP